jgi:hypothetical protein
VRSTGVAVAAISCHELAGKEELSHAKSRQIKYHQTSSNIKKYQEIS